MAEIDGSPQGSREPDEAHPPQWVGLIPAIVITGVGVIMAAWTWNTWPDVLIDFGRELHLAWQITEGRALYHDLAYFSGPLSPHVNALWFAIFGVGLRTLVWMNLALLVVLVVILYRLVREISDRFTATAAAVFFIIVFAFAQYVVTGNYNYVCPYSHELTHGLLLSLTAIYCLQRHSERPRLAFLVAAGLATGLTFLTRAEVFTACLAAVIVHALLHKLEVSRPRLMELESAHKGWMCQWIIFAASAAIPPLMGLAALSAKMPSSEAFAGFFSSWTTAMNSRVGSLKFFRDGMGTDHPIESMISILKHLGGFIAVMSPAALAAWWWKGRSHLIPAVVACIGYSAGGGIYRKSGIFFETACILPFVIIVLTVVLWRARRTADVQNRRRHSLAITLATFAFVLTGKMILNCRLYQYGFVLAMPASILMIVVLIYWLPNRLTTIGRAGGLFRGAALGLLMAVSIACLVRTNYYISQKHTTVGTGPDAFLADNRGSPANFVLGEMSALVGPDQTFGVLPEGVMLNYLARRPSGWRHANFMPTEVALFGEEAMLADLRSHPPDYLVLVHKETGEFGFRFFGKDYAAGIMAWIDRNYFELGLAGDRPFVDPLRFGMLLMKRKPPATGGQPPSADRSIGGRPPSADGGPSAGDQPPSADEVGKSPAEP